MSTGPKAQAVQKMRVFPEASFAQDHIGSLGSFSAVPFIEGTANIGPGARAQLPTNTVMQHIDSREQNVLGLKTLQLEFTVLLTGTGTAAGNGVAALGAASGTPSPLGLLLRNALGIETLGTGDLATGGSAGAPTVTTAARWDPGDAMGWVNSSGFLEVREIASESGSTETMKLAFSAAPSGGNTIYQSALYTLTSLAPATLQFVVEGEHDNDYWQLRGCQCTAFAVELPIGQLPRVRFTFTCALWAHLGNRGADISLATYNSHSPMVFADSYLFQATVGTNTYSATTSPVHATEINLNLNMQRVPLRTPTGTETIFGFARTRAVPVYTLNFTTWFEGYAGSVDTGNLDGWGNMRDSRTSKAFWIQIGRVAGSTIWISLPTTQITNVERIDLGGVAGQRVTAEGRQDTATSPNTSDRALSALRIARV